MQSDQNNEAREAWVLRAGAELWKAVVAEGSSPAEDTQKALAAVRFSLDCARRLRGAGGVSDKDLADLIRQCGDAGEKQIAALQQWGRGRGFDWDWDWGLQWGETLSSEDSTASDPTKTVTRLRLRP